MPPPTLSSMARGVPRCEMREFLMVARPRTVGPADSIFGSSQRKVHTLPTERFYNYAIRQLHEKSQQ